MEYPQDLVSKIGGASALAELASKHPDAPRRLTRDAVYMWQHRNSVPYMWRNVVRSLEAEAHCHD